MLQKNYFKGWYFKCINDDHTIAFIPAFHRSNQEETASLQIITNSSAFNIYFDSLKFQDKQLSVKIGENQFSEKGININIYTKDIIIQGNLNFSHLSPIKYDIMGPFQFIPFMQCRHSVYSMRHRIDGQINVNGQLLIFKNSMGYIEGDCGRSFPNRYIWTQCPFSNGSLMLSVADIPILGGHFTGIIGIVMMNRREYRIATYLGAKIKRISKNSVTVKQGYYELNTVLIEKNAQPLYAPDYGKMSRTIHESASCTAYYKFTFKGKKLCEFTSNRASFEFEYNLKNL